MIKLATFWNTNSDYLSRSVKEWLGANPDIKIVSTSQSSSGHSTLLHIFYKDKKKKIKKEKDGERR